MKGSKKGVFNLQVDAHCAKKKKNLGCPILNINEIFVVSLIYSLVLLIKKKVDAHCAKKMRKI